MALSTTGTFITIGSLEGLINQVRAMRQDLANLQRKVMDMSDTTSTELTTILGAVQGIADDIGKIIASVAAVQTSQTTIETLIATLRNTATGLSPADQAILDQIAAVSASGKTSADTATADAQALQAHAATIATPPVTPPAGP